MTYLLDTNTCIEHLRGAAPHVSRRINLSLPRDVVLCSVVKAELVYGALHGDKPQESMKKVEEFFELFVSIPFEDAAADEYGRIRSHLAAKGTPIGPNDLFIAAIARLHDLTLVTHNLAEFSRVPGLRIEDWTQSPPDS